MFASVLRGLTERYDEKSPRDDLGRNQNAIHATVAVDDSWQMLVNWLHGTT